MEDAKFTIYPGHKKLVMKLICMTVPCGFILKN